MEYTLTLHCPKVVQNINIRISCDERVYTRKIFDRVDDRVFISAVLNLSLWGQHLLLIAR